MVTGGNVALGYMDREAADMIDDFPVKIQNNFLKLTVF
jgi:hypothetical protein